MLLHVKISSRARSGFTLVELLVVLAIILLLVALTGSAFMQVMVVQRRSNTQQTIKTASSLLDRQWRAVLAQADAEDIPSTILNTWANGNPSLARVIWRKLRLRQAFPTNFAEALNPSPLQPLQIYSSTLNNAGIVGTFNDPSESSVCLVIALQIGQGTTNNSEDVLGSATVADSKWTGLKMLVDAWGQPLTFYRWPTGQDPTTWPNPGSQLGQTELSQQYNPSKSGPAASPNLTATFCDPLDPQGLLLNPSWNNAGNQFDQKGNLIGVGLFETYCHPVHWMNGKTWTPWAVYNVPVIVSSGPNGNLGLDINTMIVTNVDDAADNIFSYRLRFGGKGD